MTSEEWKTYESIWASKFRENLLAVTKNYRLSELSRMSGIDKASLSRYLSGEVLPSAWSIIRLGRTLGVPITDIIDYFW